MTASHLEKLSFHLYRTTGLDVSAASLEKSILSLAKRGIGDAPAEFTERYFYEETIFHVLLAVEAEDRFGFISWMIEQYEAERNAGRRLGVQAADCWRQMLLDYYVVSKERMELVGISPSLADEDEVLTLCETRLAEYQPLLSRAARTGIEGLQMSPWSIILTPRDTPLKEYLGAVVDHIHAALAAEPNPLLAPVLEIAVVQRWKAVQIIIADHVRSKRRR